MLEIIKQYFQSKRLLKAVIRNYFASGDFNGTAIFSLASEFDIASDGFKEMVRHAIETERLTVSLYVNPHILGFSHFTTTEVLEWFDKANFTDVCLYPHRSQLAQTAYLEDYEGRPYAQEMALGAGQLDFRVFDVSVLEFYRNDPRFFYWTDDIGGQVEIDGEFYRDQGVPDKDKILLKTFGFAYDDEFNRYVTVFLRYLSDLSPEHQNVWLAREVQGNFYCHPDYWRRSIQGDFGEKISLFTAFVEELGAVNAMSALMGRSSLFRNTKRPQRFEFLLRPTVAEFNAFVMLLDQMMSDNIRKSFFGDDINVEIEETRKDGKIIVHHKGTIQLLEEWLNKYFRCRDTGAIAESIATFREVRKLRQRPAHAPKEDSFDQEIFKTQRELMIRAYEAVKTIRLIFANHPDVKRAPPKIKGQVSNCEVWTI